MRRSGIPENVGFALQAMWSQKLRSFLTLLGIIAGVATVIMMVSFVVGFNNSITAAFTQFGAYLVQFQKFSPRFGGPGGPPEEERNRRDLTLDDAVALKRMGTRVAAVSPERYLFQFLYGEPIVRSRRGEANGPLVLGAAPDYCVANTHYVKDGRFFTDADLRHAAHVTVISSDISGALFPFRDAIGQQLTINGVPYTVIGLFEDKGGFLGGGSSNNFVAIPITTFDEQFPQVKDSGGDTIHIATVPKDPTRVQEWIEEGEAILRIRRGLRPNQPNDFATFTSEGQLRNFRQITGGVAAAMLVVAAIALVVGGVGVMNIMLVNVTERTREIGLRKAMGATSADVAVQFLAEAVTLTGVGGAIGIGVGLGAALLVRWLLDFPAAAPVWSIGLGFGVSTFVGLVFGLWPALRAASLDPIVALRYE
ncbi:MAG: ABC transporter permease [Acidobacteria bacterium]|nr:ABC transporter permease [Acidobacteriota bacterium]